MGQKYVSFDTTGAVTGLFDSQSSPVPAGVQAIPITDAEHIAIVSTHGYTVVNGALVPPAAPSADQLLEQARVEQVGVLQAAYQAATQQAVTFTTAEGVTQTFQADAGSQQNLLIATQGYGLAGAVPSGFYWVAADNTPVPFTLADLKGLYAAMLAQGWAAFQRLQTRKDALNAATTVSGVQAVVW